MCKTDECLGVLQAVIEHFCERELSGRNWLCVMFSATQHLEWQIFPGMLVE